MGGLPAADWSAAGRAARPSAQALTYRFQSFRSIQMNALAIEQPSAKERARAIVDAQPDDASIDEIVRELAFERMVERGLADVRAGRVVEHDEAVGRMRSWRA